VDARDPWRGVVRASVCAWSRLAEHGHDRMGPTPMSDTGAHATTTLTTMMNDDDDDISLSRASSLTALGGGTRCVRGACVCIYR